MLLSHVVVMSRDSVAKVEHSGFVSHADICNATLS